MLRDGLQRVGTGGAGSIGIEVILEDFAIQGLEPRLKETGLPKPGRVVSRIGTLQVLHCRILRICVRRAEGGRRGRTKLTPRSQHPREPRAGQRSNWIGTTPHSRHGSKGAGEDLIRAVLLGVCDGGLTHARTQIHSGGYVAGERHTGADARLGGFIGGSVDRVGLIGKEIREHGCGSARGGGMLRWIGRAGRCHDRLDGWISLARGLPHVEVFGIPSGNHGVVDGGAHQSQGASL